MWNVSFRREETQSRRIHSYLCCIPRVVGTIELKSDSSKFPDIIRKKNTFISVYLYRIVELQFDQPVYRIYVIIATIYHRTRGLIAELTQSHKSRYGANYSLRPKCISLWIIHIKRFPACVINYSTDGVSCLCLLLLLPPSLLSRSSFPGSNFHPENARNRKQASPTFRYVSAEMSTKKSRFVRMKTGYLLTRKNFCFINRNREMRCKYAYSRVVILYTFLYMYMYVIYYYFLY